MEANTMVSIIVFMIYLFISVLAFSNSVTRDTIRESERRITTRLIKIEKAIQEIKK